MIYTELWSKNISASYTEKKTLIIQLTNWLHILLNAIGRVLSLVIT